MSVDMRNSEGYLDLTAYEAIKKVEQEQRSGRAFRPIVYICSPFSGDVEGNQQRARQYCRFAISAGCIPLAPHLFFPQFMSDLDPAERNLAIFMDLVLLSKCAELWVFGSTVSKGMSIEIEKATRKAMTIRYFTDDCKEVTA